MIVSLSLSLLSAWSLFPTWLSDLWGVVVDVSHTHHHLNLPSSSGLSLTRHISSYHLTKTHTFITDSLSSPVAYVESESLMQ